MDGQIGRNDIHFTVVRRNSKRIRNAMGGKALWYKVGFGGRLVHLLYQFCCLLLFVRVFEKDEEVEYST